MKPRKNKKQIDPRYFLDETKQEKPSGPKTSLRRKAEKEEAKKLGFSTDPKGMDKYYKWIEGGRFSILTPKYKSELTKKTVSLQEEISKIP